MAFVDRDMMHEAIAARTEKRCRVCREVMPLAAFNSDASRPDGHEAICRECSRERKGTKRPRGRPFGTTLPDADRRRARTVHMNDGEWARCMAQAEAGGLDASAYVRRLVEQDA